MRFALILPLFVGPYGGEKHALCLARHLPFDVDLYTTYWNPACKDFLGKNTHVHVVGTNVSGSQKLRTLRSLLLMPKIAKKLQRYDAVCGMGWQSALALSLVRNSKTIYYCLEPPRFIYDLFDESSRKNVLKKIMYWPVVSALRFLDRFIIRRIDKVLAAGDWTADEMRKLYNRSPKIIYPGLDKARKLSKPVCRKKLGLLMNENIYLSVSKLHHRKKIDEAIRFYASRPEKNKKFFIIGNGPELHNLMKLAKQLDKNIVFVGEVSDASELQKWYAAADYFIFTSVNEPYGLAPMEAKLNGCKILPKDHKRKIISWGKAAELFIQEISK